MRSSNFSLRFMKIGLSVFVEARSKVDPRIESYVWVPKSWSFVKLHEVENIPTWIISSLKPINDMSVFRGRNCQCDLVQDFGTEY